MRAVVAAVASAIVAAALAGCGADPAPPQLTRTVVAGAPAPTETVPTERTVAERTVAERTVAERTVAVDGVLLAGPDALAPTDPDVETLRAAAESGRRSTMLVVSNYVPDLGMPSGDLARTMLADPVSRDAVVTDVAAAARGFDGVQVALSGLAAPDSDALVAFMAALHDALPGDVVVVLGVVASTDFGGYRERGYDIAALEASVDRFVLQTFEPGGAALPPEPLGDLARIGEEVDYLTSQLDAERIDLGITVSDGLSLAEAIELATASGLHGVVVAGQGYPPG